MSKPDRMSQEEFEEIAQYLFNLLEKVIIDWSQATRVSRAALAGMIHHIFSMIEANLTGHTQAHPILAAKYREKLHESKEDFNEKGDNVDNGT